MDNSFVFKYKWIIFFTAVLAIILIYTFFDPLESKFFPKCPFYAVTGYQCPGCGTQRAIYNLLHGHFLTAIKNNLLFVISLPYLFLGAILDIADTKNTKLEKFRQKFYNDKILIALSFIILFYWFFRNTNIYHSFLNHL